MALINKIDNSSSIVYGGQTIKSNTVETLLALAPTIVKAVDKLTANIGDTLSYTVTITNISLTAINNLAFSDTIQAGATYIDSSFKVDNKVQTPTITGTTLAYTIPTIGPLASSVITFQVTVVGGS